MRVAPEIVLSDEERAVLDDLIRSKLTSVRLALRARIVLLAAQGLQNKEIAQALDVGRIQASRWRERYLEFGLPGIARDLPRGAPPSTVDSARLIELTTQSKPEAATRWSTRTLAAELGVSAASISRHWRKKGLKPDLVCGPKVSRDPVFVEKSKTNGSVPVATRTCVGAVLRREEPGAGDGPDAARAADEEGARGQP